MSQSIDTTALTPDQRTLVALVSTPPYSNTTLACVLPTLFAGCTLITIAKFHSQRYLELA